MKKIIMFIILGCLTLYGFSINPIDPPTKSGDNAINFTPTSPASIVECSDLYSSVPVTVVVTITDCPDYKCSLPDTTCTIQLCIYQGSCLTTPIICIPFDPNTCSYNRDIRADEGYFLYSKLVVTGCTNYWNTACNGSNIQVPLGGGTLYINQQFCP